MIVLNVFYKCFPDMRDEFLEAIKTEGLDEASRAEEGNLKYDYYLADDNENEILLVEHWKDEAALDLHKTMPHFARLGEVKAEYVEETVIEVY